MPQVKMKLERMRMTTTCVVAVVTISWALVSFFLFSLHFIFIFILLTKYFRYYLKLKTELISRHPVPNPCTPPLRAGCTRGWSKPGPWP